MRTKKEIEQKLAEIENKVIEYRSNKNFCDEHWLLTEQMAVLRWVTNNEWEWEDSGIRDT